VHFVTDKKTGLTLTAITVLARLIFEGKFKKMLSSEAAPAVATLIK
jgi:hypothetical protein